jgi:hypothetical protein
MLVGERYSKSKLADMLFTVIISTKLPPEASSAIQAVAFLIEDEALASLADKAADKILLSLSPAIDSLNSTIASAKSFLDATSQKQAAATLNLQEVAKHHSELANSLADSSTKFTQASNPRNLSDSEWPLPFMSNAPHPHSTHPASLLSSSSPASLVKVQQHTLLTSKQLMIEYSPLEEEELPHERSVTAQCMLCDQFNSWIDDNTESIDGINPTPSRAVRGVTMFDRPAFLVKFDSPEAKDHFVNLCDTKKQWPLNPRWGLSNI